MKKLIFLVIPFLLIMSACSNKTKEKEDVISIVSHIEITNKDEKGEEYWITAEFYNEEDKVQEVNVIIQDKNIWNLININTKYVAHFAKDSTNKYHLYEIDQLK